MIFQYYPETDMLYIKLSMGVSMESEEVAPGIVLDFDASRIVAYCALLCPVCHSAHMVVE